MITVIDNEFLAECTKIGSMSDCENRTVGSVIVWQNRIIGRGWNHNPIPGSASCATACPRRGLPPGDPNRTGDYDLCIYVHAEAKAIINAGGLTQLATLYCSEYPCAGCWKLIHAAGIVRVVWPGDGSAAESVAAVFQT